MAIGAAEDTEEQPAKVLCHMLPMLMLQCNDQVRGDSSGIEGKTYDITMYASAVTDWRPPSNFLSHMGKTKGHTCLFKVRHFRQVYLKMRIG